MRREYIIIAFVIAVLNLYYCSSHMYHEGDYTVYYYSKYRMLADNDSLYNYSKYRIAADKKYLTFNKRDIIGKQDLLKYNDYFKVFYSATDVIVRVEQYKYNMRYRVRHNDMKDGRLIRLENYSNGQLAGYYVNYYNDLSIITQRRFFDASDKLERVERFE